MTTFSEVLEEVSNLRAVHEQYRDELRGQLRQAVADLRAGAAELAAAGHDGTEPATVNIKLPVPVLNIDQDAAPATQVLDFMHWCQFLEAAYPVYEAIDACDLDEADRLLSDDGPLARLWLAGEVELSGQTHN